MLILCRSVINKKNGTEIFHISTDVCSQKFLPLCFKKRAAFRLFQWVVHVAQILLGKLV